MTEEPRGRHVNPGARSSNGFTPTGPDHWEDECTDPTHAPRHTVRGKTSDGGWPYGTTHDLNCPACVASGSSFLNSPRSETYWSS